ALVQREDDFRPVFEMHCVVVVPLATPDEAVLLEDADDLPGDLVLVEIAGVGIALGPLPIMRLRAGNIDRDTQTVCALAIRGCDQTTVIGAFDRPEEGA